MAATSFDANATPAAQLQFYIERLDPKDQTLFRAVRAALRKRLPTVNEMVYDYKTFLVISYTPTEHGKDGIVSISTREDRVRLYFNSAKKLPDPKKLLMGSATQVRFIRVESAKQLAHPDVEALIAAAIDHAIAPLPSDGPGKLIIQSSAATKRSPRKPAKKVPLKRK